MQNIENKRHSLSHIMAWAIKDLFPEVKFGIGPTIENGFYYDFDLSNVSSGKSGFAPEDLPRIESKMKDFLKKDVVFEKQEISKEQAKEMFKNQQYKLELIDDLKDSEITIYKSGNFVDLCKGPHVKSTKEINTEAFKLTKTAGAYWRGSEKNPMLQRIYGVAFDTKKELEDYFFKLEEAEKRDHRTLGQKMDLFHIDESVGPGLILWHPKLSFVREQIEMYWRMEHRKRGYQYIYTPHVGLSKLWETSGHLNFFKEGMYPPMSMETKSKEEKTTYYVKPMSCPFHVKIYNSRIRSYKELPIRWCELGSVYRYEESGVLHGMLRVRGFTQDDAHIICREDQFVKEVSDVLKFALDINKVFGFRKLNVYLSVRDPANKQKYVGNDKIWEFAEGVLKVILKKKNIAYKEDFGGAKFYGPAIDLKAVDAIGREWQGTTIQLDFNLPQRFNMTYAGQDGQKHTPVMIHRTLLGAMERFVGTFIEHHAGYFPLWLSPIQAWIIPIGRNHAKYAKQIGKEFQLNDLRIEIRDESESVSKKIREGEIQRIPYLLVVGDKEVKSRTVSVRSRNKDLGKMKVKKFIDKIKIEVEKKK